MNQVQTSYSVYNMKYLSSHVVCKLSLWGLECFSIMRKKCKVNSLVQSFAIDCSSEWIYVHCGQIILTKFWFFFFSPPPGKEENFHHCVLEKQITKPDFLWYKYIWISRSFIFSENELMGQSISIVFHPIFAP